MCLWRVLRCHHCRPSAVPLGSQGVNVHHVSWSWLYPNPFFLGEPSAPWLKDYQELPQSHSPRSYLSISLHSSCAGCAFNVWVIVFHDCYSAPTYFCWKEGGGGWRGFWLMKLLLFADKITEYLKREFDLLPSNWTGICTAEYVWSVCISGKRKRSICLTMQSHCLGISSSVRKQHQWSHSVHMLYDDLIILAPGQWSSTWTHPPVRITSREHSLMATPLSCFRYS